MKLSTLQLAALRSIVKRYDAAVQNERTRWGAESARRVAARGVEAVDLRYGAVRYDYRTWHALEKRGLLQLGYVEGQVKRDRRGAYGKRIGGTHAYDTVETFAIPTELGRLIAGVA